MYSIYENSHTAIVFNLAAAITSSSSRARGEVPVVTCYVAQKVCIEYDIYLLHALRSSV